MNKKSYFHIQIRFEPFTVFHSVYNSSKKNECIKGKDACYAPIKNHIVCKKLFVGITFYGFGKLTLRLYIHYFNFIMGVPQIDTHQLVTHT